MRKRRLIFFGVALIIVIVGLLVLVPYLQERQQHYERVRRITVSEAASDLPEIIVRLMASHVGVDTPYTITTAQIAPYPEGFFQGPPPPRREIWCITVDPAMGFLFGPQKNYIAAYIGKPSVQLLETSFMEEAGWGLYPFRVDKSMFDAMGCTWAD